MVNESGGFFFMQKCKNCWAVLSPNSKFCTKCGTPVAEVGNNTNGAYQPQRSIVSERNVNNLKERSINYFGWFKNSLKKPSQVDYDNKYYGLISLVINALLVAWAIYTFGYRSVMTGMDAVNSARYYFGGSASQSGFPDGIQLFLNLFLMALVYYAVFLIVGFLCKKYMVNNEIDIFSYSTELASFSNSMLLINLLIVISLLMFMPSNINNFNASSLLGSLKFLIVLIVLSSNIWVVSYISSIVVDQVKMNLDKIYVAVITLVVNSAVLYFVFKMIYNALVAKYSSYGMGMFGRVLG